MTGDLLVSNISSLKSAQRKLHNKHKTSENDDDIDILNVLGIQPKIPSAVYFCSVEPPSLSQQLALENALKQLQREDPSLQVQYDESTMQTVLGGMGELHLDIIKSRIKSEFKIDAELGPLQIAYKETLEVDARNSITIEKEISGIKQEVMIDLSLVNYGNETFRVDTSPEATQNLSLLRPRFIQVVKKGALSALERGPRIGGQIIDTKVILHNMKIGRGTADSFLMNATTQCVQKVIILK